MIGEFRAFLLKTNALALAIGVIIGGALGTVVNSLVNDIIMPPIGLLLGGVDFGSAVIELKKASIDAVTGEPIPAVDIRYGAFINAIIAFIVIAFVVWQVSRTFIKEPAPPEVKTCPFCKEPNASDASKCRACASAI